MVASFYRIAVGAWKIQPADFWAMSPQEFWQLERFHSPPPMLAGMEKSKFEHLVGVLNG